MRGLKSICGAAALLALAACGNAGSGAPNEPGKSGLDVKVHKGDFAEIQQFTTPGGVSVWLVSEPSIPILAVNMAWKGGSINDPEGLEGLTGAVTYNMNEGAGDLDSLAYQTRMEELNMSFGCSSSAEWVSCSADMLTDNANEAMDLVALAFKSPRFDAGPIERMQREELIGIKQQVTNARWLAGQAFEERFYPGHPYDHDVTEESIQAITPELVREHMRKLMTRDDMLVTAVGAISPEELAPLIDRVVMALPEVGDDAEVADITVPPAEGAAPIVIDLPQPQSLVSFRGPGIERDDPDFFTAYVVNYTMGGGGFESRMMKELRVERGLTYGIYTGLSTGEHLNTWGGGGQTKNSSAGEFVAGVKEEIRKIAETGLTADELADAKAYLIGSYPLGFDSNSKIAGNMMGVRQDELGVDYFDKRNAMFESVTLADANRVAKEYLDPDNFTFVVVGQPEGLDAD